MIVELLTPLVIATAPVRIDLPEIAYSHETQVSVARADVTGYGYPTVSATQTFDGAGRPMDSDND